MANCCQKVRGNKTNQRPKQQQNKKLKQQHKTTAQNRKTGRGILSYRFYFIDFLERFIWILFYIFYFTDFILHDSPKSQLTLEFSGLAYLLLNAVHLFHSCLSLCPTIQAPRTIDYEECTISDDSWAGKHERRNDHMIYLTLSHSLEVLFPSCYAISTFSATP